MITANQDQENLRKEITINFIPPEIKTALDLGSGDCKMAEIILAKRGIDIVVSCAPREDFFKSRLKSKVVCLAQEPSFKNISFDLIIATEINEHIAKCDNKKFVNNVKRLAKNYILLSVPLDEDLFVNITRCKRCGREFHAWQHTQRFTPRRIKYIFKPEFEVVRYEEFGGLKPCYDYFTRQIIRSLYVLLHKAGKYWGQKIFGCPFCGDMEKDTYEGTCNLFGRILLRVIWRIAQWYPVKKRSFAIALYRRKSTL